MYKNASPETNSTHFVEPKYADFFLSFFSNPISLSSVQFLAPRSPCHIHKVANLTPDDDENSRARVHLS